MQTSAAVLSRPSRPTTTRLQGGARTALVATIYTPSAKCTHAAAAFMPVCRAAVCDLARDVDARRGIQRVNLIYDKYGRLYIRARIIVLSEELLRITLLVTTRSSSEYRAINICASDFGERERRIKLIQAPVSLARMQPLWGRAQVRAAKLPNRAPRA